MPHPPLPQRLPPQYQPKHPSACLSTEDSLLAAFRAGVNLCWFHTLAKNRKEPDGRRSDFPPRARLELGALRRIARPRHSQISGSLLSQVAPNQLFWAIIARVVSVFRARRRLEKITRSLIWQRKIAISRKENELRLIFGNPPHVSITTLVAAASIFALAIFAVPYGHATTQGTSQLGLISATTQGLVIAGYYTSLSQNGIVYSTQYTSATIPIFTGQSYPLSAENFGACTFSNWSNGTTSNPATFVTAPGMTFTAIYNCNN